MKNKIDQSAYKLMASGGDHRIAIDEKIGFNKYGCKPFPSYSISYSSSTGSNISSSAYAYIKSYIHKLRVEKGEKNIEDVQILKREFETIRQRLRTFYELDPDVEIIFGPSGTDMEYLTILFALKAGESHIHNIVLGANEVGSGIEFAAEGQYFSDRTPIDNALKKVGESIEGMPSDRVSTAYIPIRNTRGEVYSSEQILEHFNREIKQALATGQRPLVHIVHATKTGLILPSWETLMKLKNEYGTAIDLVVDACQGRISIYSINRYLSFGAMVLLTGSKFLSGPPFSGALLLPQILAKRIVSIQNLPKGLTDFFGEAEFPVKWTTGEKQTDNLENFGLLLRWQASIYEMDKLFKIPNTQLKFIIDCFLKSVDKMVNDTPFLSLYENTVEKKPDYVYKRNPFEINTICTLLIRNKNERRFDKEDAKLIHKALYSDISNIAGHNALAKTSVQLGQPVKISDTDKNCNATLRVALSAHLISELALLDEDMIKMRFFADMDRIKKKLSLILDYFDTLKKHIAIA